MPAENKDIKEAQANQTERTNAEENGSYGLARNKASLLRQHVPPSPGTISTLSSSLSLTPEIAPHRLLMAKASISGSQMGSSVSHPWEAHRLSLESLNDGDQPLRVEIENTPPYATGLRDSPTVSTTTNGETAYESRSFCTVEWVNNEVGFSAESTELCDDEGQWEDMEQALAASVPRGPPEDRRFAQIPVAAPALTAVIVDDEEERERIETESRQIAARTAILAEVVDVNKRRIVVGSVLLIALAVILSLVTTLVSTTSNTASPSMPPTIDAVQNAEWVEIANTVSLSGTKLVYPAVGQASTAEIALAWLIEESSDVIRQRAIQRFAFLLLAFSWNNPEWNITADFDECKLKGVTCDDNSSCIEMDLTAAGLTGTIPPEIALLSDMRKLVLWDNSLTGPVPWEPMLLRMQTMEFVDLDINELTGPLPSPEHGTWPLIEIFWVAKNQFTGTISPGFAYWPVLEDFYVRDNLLSGGIPSELGAISTMNWFAVDENDLYGTLPTEIGGWTSIRHFEVEGNRKLTGTIPTEVGQWTMIQDFFCHMNQFNGTLPAEIGEWSRIKRFRAEFNAFSGALPTGMSSWTKLTSLYLNNNDFNGALPAGIENLTLLEEIQINNNRLTGSLSSSMGSWEHLKLGYFQVNGFEGSMTELCSATGAGAIISADCCEVVCPCCSSCFVDDGIPGPNCTFPSSVEP